MASSLPSALLLKKPISYSAPTSTMRGRRRPPTLVMAMAASEDDSASSSSQKSTKLVTFLGKGGSGKTTSAVFAAQVLFSFTLHLLCYLDTPMFNLAKGNITV